MWRLPIARWNKKTNPMAYQCLSKELREGAEEAERVEKRYLES
jgi:hypothetical protein